MDLSVMHDNHEAIALYRKIGFEQIPVYSIKRKNPINEKLYIGPAEDAKLNIYAQIIVDEARRRGIQVEVEDAEAGLFRLSHGGRAIACRESLSDLTSAVALSRCDDKRLTHRLLDRAGLRLPEQVMVTSDQVCSDFCARHERIVVKPARGEQGQGVAVDLRREEDVKAAIKTAEAICEAVILEEYVEGQDLRIIVIDDNVVAAALRKPPTIKGDGETSVRELIEKLSRRRAAATDGESGIPMDNETFRCVRSAGRRMTDILPEGERITVRRTANLHTGGTIHDVTDILHEDLRNAAIKAAQKLEIPVVGMDFVVKSPEIADYAVIEANERPGLANHQPQPTVERFIDLLFPQTAEFNRKKFKETERK
jgi:GNAT-family acetyltransferase (TIGR03103 family)